jgi:hypothetical protein
MDQTGPKSSSRSDDTGGHHLGSWSPRRGPKTAILDGKNRQFKPHGAALLLLIVLLLLLLREQEQERGVGAFANHFASVGPGFTFL